MRDNKSKNHVNSTLLPPWLKQLRKKDQGHKQKAIYSKKQVVRSKINDLVVVVVILQPDATQSNLNGVFPSSYAWNRIFETSAGEKMIDNKRKDTVAGLAFVVNKAMKSCALRSCNGKGERERERDIQCESRNVIRPTLWNIHMCGAFLFHTRERQLDSRPPWFFFCMHSAFLSGLSFFLFFYARNMIISAYFFGVMKNPAPRFFSLPLRFMWTVWMLIARETFFFLFFSRDAVRV